jgi:hypothetical protein
MPEESMEWIASYKDPYFSTKYLRYGAASRLHQRTNCPHKESAKRLETKYKHSNYWMIGSQI